MSARWLIRVILAVSRFAVIAGILISPLVFGPSPAEAKRGDGMLMYAAASNTTPQIKTYSQATNSFTNAGTPASGTQPVITQLKSSPFKNEFIGGYEDPSGNLRIVCFDGSSWSSEWSVTVAGSGTTRRFDIAFETSTGDVTVAYARNTTTTNGLAFRTKPGSTGCGTSNWAAAQNFPNSPSVTTGNIQWVKAARDGRAGSDLATFIWADSNSDLGTAVWSGSGFTNFQTLETSLEVVSAAQDVDNFEVQYESTSGDAMVVWANSSGNNGTMGGMYATCAGGTSSCSWSAPAKIWTQAGDDATSLDLSADPTSDRMAFASIGNAGADLQAAYWNGSSWTRYANLDTTCESPAAGRRLTQTGWVTNNGNTRWIITYDDASGTGLSWYAATPGSAPAKQTDFTTSPTINDIRNRYQIDNHPFNDATLMLLVSDSTKKVMAERLSMDASGNLAWVDASAGSGAATTNVVPAEGFSFVYNRYSGPLILNFDIVDGSGTSVPSPSIGMSTQVFDFGCGSSTGTLGTLNQRLRISNSTLNPSWVLSIAATDGPTAQWSGGSGAYDYNDQAGAPPGCSAGGDADSTAGLLGFDGTGGSVDPDPTCTSTGVSLGSAASFEEGTQDSVTLVSSGSDAETECYWDVTGIEVAQTIPAEQPAGLYGINLTLTLAAN